MPDTFLFLAQFVDKLEKNYRSNLYLYDLNLTPSSIGVKLIRQGTLSTPKGIPRWPCSLCTIKGFQADHYSLSSMNCGFGKLSAPDTLELISYNHLGPSCTQAIMGIQYDTGCQLSLISCSTLSSLPPPSMFSLGLSSRVRVLTYAGKGRVILTTEVKLKLHGKPLKLSKIEEDLNNSSGFSLSIPH